MFAVRRIFEKFYARLGEALAKSPAKRWLFGQCVARGWRVESKGAGWLDAVATPLLRALVAKPVLARLGGRMRLTVVGGAALDPEIAHTFIGLGLPLLQGYGMTEASPVISVNRVGDNDPESVGPPLPGIEIKLGEGSELLARGGNVMLGYWRNEKATQAAIDADGWLHTGDVGVLDERGYLRITDRLKDMFIVGGFNCYPAEIERMLAEHPAIAQVAVVGVPDERLGEVGCACVLLRPDAALTCDELVVWSRERMSNYKVPRHLLVLDAFPLTASNKVVKRELARLAAQRLR